MGPHLLLTPSPVLWSLGREWCWKDIDIQDADWRLGGDLWQGLSERTQVSGMGGFLKVSGFPPPRKLWESHLAQW